MPFVTRRRATDPRRSTVLARMASPLAASVLALAFVAGSLVAGATVAPLPAAEAATAPAPTASLTFDPAKNGGKDTILAGADAVYTVTIANNDTVPWFNVGVRLTVPNGIVFTPTSALGTPVVYPSGSQITNASAGSTTTAVPAGSQVWVWEDVSDLPAGADYSADFTVAPRQKTPGTAVDTAPDYFPVGSSVALSATMHASDVATLNPLFSGSTGVRTAANLAGTRTSAAAAASTKVVALHVFKDEPSPETELLRGVHEATTVYTLTVRNTTQGATGPMELVDYLPAGLEFLGCGVMDKTSGGVEYAGSGDLTTTPAVTPCVAPARVETVERTASSRSSFPASMGPDGANDGVYTKVTWSIAAVAAGGRLTVQYAAGIPLFANTMWSAAAPSATGLEQAANLDNNTGASTRHSDGDGAPTDGDVYTNFAAATGAYAGIVRAVADRASGDHDEEAVHSMDLRILKSVDSDPTSGAPTPFAGADGRFRTGYVAKYTLAVRASEYTDTTGIAVTDQVPNGLCPVVPSGTTVRTGDIAVPLLDGGVKHITGSATLPAECAIGATSSTPGRWSNPAVSGPASIEWVAYDSATGEFYLRFTAFDVAAGGDASIVYPVLMRQTYEKNEGLTSAQDRLTNSAIFTATTTTTSDAYSRDAASRVQSVADDSSASLTSGSATISKRVLPVAAAVGAGAGDPCPTSGYSASTEGGFKLGDTVCYELRVNFQADADTRNPLVTDMLPVGVTYTDSVSSLTKGGAPVSFSDNVVEPAAGGNRITWAPSSLVQDGDDFVPRGSTLVIHVWGTVSTLSLDPAKLDKPQNLMKFQQENVHGDVFFLRDSADILVDAGLSLVKGVARVGASGTFAASTGGCVGTAPNCDHVLIKEGDIVTYRVDVTGAPYAVSNVVVWDALPAGIKAANVAPSPQYDVVDTAPAGYDGPAGRSVIAWKPLALAAGTGTSLTYVVTMPANITSGTTYSNTASIISYDVDNNSGTSTYRPFNSLGPITDNNVPGAKTTDVSDVYVPPATLDKSVVSTGIDAAADANNGAKVTHGEDVTYKLSVTIPARTSVSGAVLQDDGFLSSDGGTTKRVYVPGSATVAYPADATQPASAFTFNTTSGRLQFPALYDNATDAPQTFSVTLTVHSTSNWAHGNTLTNLARFTATGLTAIVDAATVVYAQPSPQVTKTVSSGAANVVAGQTLTYTLAVNNDPGRPIAYDTVVTDCVPSQLRAVTYTGTPSQGTAVAPEVASLACGGTGTLITWNVGDVASGAADRTLSYSVVVDPTSAGGAAYTNTALLSAWALDSAVAAPRNLKLADSATVTVTIDSASVAKTVTPASAPVGAIVQYDVDVTLPLNVNFYDATIVDPAPSGVRFTGPVTVVGAGTGVTCAVVSNAIACSTPDNGGHILSAPAVRHITLSYAGVIVSTTASPAAPVTGAQLTNTATFGWKTAAGGASTLAVTGSATVTVLEPSLSIVKQVESQDANTVGTAVTIAPGQGRSYAITVSNPALANASTAFDAVITDAVPSALVVDAASIGGGGVLAADGRTITWSIPSLAVGASTVLTYSVTLAPSAGHTPDSTLLSTKNVATATEYFSHGDETNADRRRYTGGSDPAYVRPVFPHVVVAKDTSAGNQAKVGAPFSWTVTLTNTGGATAKSVVATDTLPANWSYTATTSVSLKRGAAVTPIAASGYVFSAADLTWTFADLAAGDAIVIVYTATPSAGAYTDPGVGAPLTVPHTNSIAITRVTDATDAAGNAVDTDYLGGPDAADAYLVATDVTVRKTRVGTAQVNAGDLVDFTLTAENAGAQPADGVTIVDTLPTGLTFDPARVAAPGTPGSDFTCTVTANSSITCLLAGSLAAGASRSVVVRAFALDIPSALASTTMTNSADITTTTPETDLADNHDDLAITVFAPQISIVKTGAFAAGAVGAVGEVVDFEFTVTNLIAGATLTGVAVTDAMFPAAGDITYGAWPSGVAGTLGAGQSVVAHAAYAITQSDIDEGYVRNLAAVTGVPPIGPAVADTDTVDVAIANNPSILLVKSGVLDDAAPTRAGHGVTYAFTVTNTGNVTLGSVGIDDRLAGLSAVRFAAGFSGSLAPGESVTATAHYGIRQGDVDAGSVANTAEASGTSKRGGVATHRATATVAIVPEPAIQLEKTVALDPVGTFTRGDGVRYDFVIRNTGTVTLSGVQVADGMVGLSLLEYSWPGRPGVLAPGARATATARYAMTQADLDAGSIANTATASGSSPAGAGVASSDKATVKLTPKPTIKLAMTARFATGARGLVGDTVHFDYVVTNSGNMTLAGLRLVSKLPGISAMTYGPWPLTEYTLAPGESVTATASYRLTVADVLAGTVDNDSEVTALADLEGVTSAVSAEDAAAVPVPTLLAATGFSLVTPLEIVALLMLLGFALLILDVKNRRRRAS